jgi:hypothetical protein
MLPAGLASILALFLVLALHNDPPSLHGDLNLLRPELRGVQGDLQLAGVLLDPDDLVVLLLEEVEVPELVRHLEAGQHPPPGEVEAILSPPMENTLIYI